jgi:hypothetical protein
VINKNEQRKYYIHVMFPEKMDENTAIWEYTLTDLAHSVANTKIFDQIGSQLATCSTPICTSYSEGEIKLESNQNSIYF